MLLQWRWLAVSSAIARRQSLNSVGRVVLQLNREIAMAQLLPSASQAITPPLNLTLTLTLTTDPNPNPDHDHEP